MQSRIVERALEPRQTQAMIGEEEHDGAVGQTVGVELGQQAADLFVHERD